MRHIKNKGILSGMLFGITRKFNSFTTLYQKLTLKISHCVRLFCLLIFFSPTGSSCPVSIWVSCFTLLYLILSCIFVVFWRLESFRRATEGSSSERQERLSYDMGGVERGEAIVSIYNLFLIIYIKIYNFNYMHTHIYVYIWPRATRHQLYATSWSFLKFFL